MATVGELVAILRADAKQFTATMEGAQAEVGALEAETTTAAASMNKAMLGIGAASVAGIALSVKAFQDWADQVRTVQRVSGLSAEQASKLTFAMNAVGISSAATATAVGLLGKNIENQSGNFEKYGLQVTKANGDQKNLIQILGAAADKYVALGGGLKGAAFAQNIFGRGGKALIPILKGGADGLREYMQEAKQLGLVMSKQDLDASLQLTLAGRKLEETFKGLGVTLGREFVPVVTQMVDGFQKAVQWLDNLNPDVVANALRIGVLVGAIAAAVKVLKFLGSGISAVVRLFELLTGTSKAAAAAQKTVELSAADAAAAEKALVISETGVVEANAEITGSSAAAAGGIDSVGAASVTAGGGLKAFGAAAFAARGQIALALAGAYALVGGFKTLTKSAGDSATQFGVTDDAANAIYSRIKQNGPMMSNWLHAFADPLGGAFNHSRDEAVQAFADFQAAAVNAGRGQGQINDALSTALPLLNANRASIGSFSDALYKAVHLQQTASGSTNDLTTSLDDLLQSSSQFGQINRATGMVQGALAQLASVSGQDMSAVEKSWTDLMANTKATGADYIAEIDQLKAAEDAFTSSTISAFGGSSGAISQFFGKSHVDFGKLEGDLASYKSQLSAWSKAFHTIQANGGKDATQFLTDMRAQGLGSIGILQAVAGQTKKNQQKFLDMYNSGNSATANLADVITKKLVPKFDIMIARLTAIAIKLGALPAPKIDNSQALNSLHAIQVAAEVTREKLLGLGGAARHGRGAGGPGSSPGGTTNNPDNNQGTGGSHWMGGMINAIARHFAMGGDTQRYASGGGVDTVPAMLQPGEYVMRKAAVDKYGAGFFDSLNRAPFGTTMSGTVHSSLNPLGQGQQQQQQSTHDKVAKKLDDLLQGWSVAGLTRIGNMKALGSVGQRLHDVQDILHELRAGQGMLSSREVHSLVDQLHAAGMTLGAANQLIKTMEQQYQASDAYAQLHADRRWMTQSFKNVSYLPEGHTNISTNHHHDNNNKRGGGIRVILDRRHYDQQASYQEDYGRGF